MTVHIEQYDLIQYWSKNPGGIALAYEFKDGSIVSSDGQPCHQGLGKYVGAISQRLEGTTRKQSDIRGVYVKLTHGANIKWSRQWFEFIASPKGPWQLADATIVTTEDDKYVALHIDNVDKKEAQIIANLAFASRVPYQRAGTLGLWADLVNTHKYHPTVALFVVSRVCYDHTGTNIMQSMVAYDFLFKGSQESVVSFYRLWHGAPNITKSCHINTLDTYGMPNEIWIETDKKRAVATDFLPKILKEVPYTGFMPHIFRATTGRDKHPNGVKSLKDLVEVVDKEIPNWPK